MKDEQHKIDKILKQGFKETKLDSPSGDFTKDLMSKINAIAPEPAMRYTSLLSNPVKIAIISVFIGVIVYFVMKSDMGSASLLSTFIQMPDWSFNLPKFDLDFEISNAILYGSIFFMLLFGIQIYFIKNKIKGIKY